MASVEGLNKLLKQLDGIEHATSLKILRNSVRGAMAPTFREIRAIAPVGKIAHRTFQGRLVGPGHFKRSLRLRSKIGGGKVAAWIAAKPEGFYGMFVHAGYANKKRVPAREFFFRIFEKNLPEIQNEVARQVKRRINKIR